MADDVSAEDSTGKRAKPSMADKAAAARLRALWDKRAKHVTQQLVADMLEISQPAISQYIHGNIPLNFLAVSAFAKVLHCDPREIRDDLPEQQFFARFGLNEAPGAYVVTSEEEKAILDKYREADTAGKASLQAVGTALAKSPNTAGKAS